MPGLKGVKNSFLIFINELFGLSMSFQSYMNPVISGDCSGSTITKIGNDCYTKSIVLFYMEVVIQPVFHSRSRYGESWLIF
jgi:hypothetical protein